MYIKEDIEHPDITSAHKTGYSRRQWREILEYEQEEDCDESYHDRTEWDD